MTTQTIRSFMERNGAAAAGLSALGGALDALATGAPLDPAIAGRIDELLGAMGAADALAGVTAPEAAALLAELRHMMGLDAKLLWGRTRAPGWAHTERELLQAIGDFARNHAVMLTRAVIPALGLGARFAAPGASLLDVGVGAAGLAIQFAELWPTAKVVGIDVLQSVLALARDNVASSTVAARVEIREQGAEHLTDESAYDLAWVPMPFIPQAAIEAASPRIRRALKPGGWVVQVFINGAAIADPAAAAVWRLRNTMWGGPSVTPAGVETMLRDNGYVGVRTLPGPPGTPVGVVVGQRAE